MKPLERVTGIEPVTEAWEAFVIPFHHTRVPELGDRLMLRQGQVGATRGWLRFAAKKSTRYARPKTYTSGGLRPAKGVLPHLSGQFTVFFDEPLLHKRHV